MKALTWPVWPWGSETFSSPWMVIDAAVFARHHRQVKATAHGPVIENLGRLWAFSRLPGPCPPCCFGQLGHKMPGRHDSLHTFRCDLCSMMHPMRRSLWELCAYFWAH